MQKKVNRAVIGKPDDSRCNESDSHVPGMFILARKELRNTVITADIWETLKQVATSEELQELGRLEILTGAYYRDEDECADVDEWIDKVLADHGDYETNIN